MATPVNNTDWIEWATTLLEGVSRETHTATLPPDRFYCLLDELPLHLIPQRHRASIADRERTQHESPQQHVLNPSCVLTEAGNLPDDLASHSDLFSRFPLQGTIAWVRDESTFTALPFWIGPKFKTMIESFTPGEPVPATLSHQDRAVLTVAGILKLVGADVSRHQPNDRVTQLSKLFREKGYAPLRDLIHPFHVAALRRYYRYLIRKGEIQLGDGQSPRRYIAYNDQVARFFHHQIAATLSAVAGEIVKPSYVYMASYLSGAELKKHTDREQCEFSITLCLDFSPEPALETLWPIKLDTPTGSVTVYQALGDGLAYRGTRLPHYRDPLPEGYTSTSIFFHYVAADFKGSLA